MKFIEFDIESCKTSHSMAVYPQDTVSTFSYIESRDMTVSEEEYEYPEAKGQISRETTIWCDLCPEWNSQPGVGNAPRWRKAGWKLTRERGWICPNCVQITRARK